MKTAAATFSFLAALVSSALAEIPAPQILHHFRGVEANPIAPLVLGPDGNFYGTSPSGGNSGRGTVFRITPDGVSTTLVTFTGPNGQTPWNVGLKFDNKGNLYGATERGGSSGRGTIFKATLTGELTTLVHFNDANGTAPRGLTIDSEGNLFGTTVTGLNANGTLFKVDTNGVFTSILNFPPSLGSFPASLTIDPSGHLYGRTYNGSDDFGVAYRVAADGVLTNLVAVTGSPHAYATDLTPGDDGNLYGTTMYGGTNGFGIAFRITDAGVLSTLVNFDRSNGMLPTGPLTVGEDGNFYGTTMYGGVYEGTVFKMTPKGDLTTLANFPSRSTGVRPYGGVIFGSDGSLYGTTITGGNQDCGVMFRVDLPPTITSQPASQTAGVGTKVTFAVKAMGTKPHNYQWTKDGEDLTDSGDISGATTGTLTLTNVSLRDAGDYTVTVSNPWGIRTSAEAVLVVTTDDEDGDGVPNEEDQCPDTSPGVIVDKHGCSIDQLVPCEGPRPGVQWKSHGQYVAAVVKVVYRLKKEGLITKSQARQIIAVAAQSDCGRKRPSSSRILLKR